MKKHSIGSSTNVELFANTVNVSNGVHWPIFMLCSILLSELVVAKTSIISANLVHARRFFKCLEIEAVFDRASHRRDFAVHPKEKNKALVLVVPYQSIALYLVGGLKLWGS